MFRLLLSAAVLIGLFGVTGCTSMPEPAPLAGDAPPAAPREFRAMWVATVANIDWPSKPGLPVAQQRAEALALLDRAGRQRAMGIASTSGEASVRYPDDSSVDPRDVVAALRLVLERLGVDIVENSPTAEVESGGMQALVIAAGAWSSSLRVLYNGRAVALPEAFPVKGHLLGYRMQAGSLDTILRRGHTYILQRSNGFTIAGSNEEDAGFERHVDPEV